MDLFEKINIFFWYGFISNKHVKLCQIQNIVFIYFFFVKLTATTTDIRGDVVYKILNNIILCLSGNYIQIILID